MASLRGVSFASATTGSLSIAKPTGAAAGDVVLVFATVVCTGTNSGAGLGTMTGWTATASTQNGTNTSFACRGFALLLTGSESWPFTLTTSGTNINVSGAQIADYASVSNFDPTTLIAPVIANTGTALIGAAMTLANSGDWIAWFGQAAKNASTTAQVVSLPTGFANGTDSGNTAGSTASLRQEFGDLETAQSSGSYTPPNGSIPATGAHAEWCTGIVLGTSGSATLTCPGMTMAAPVLTPAATVQSISLTVLGMTFAAPVVNPKPTAQGVTLTAPAMTLAAPIVQIGKGINLTAPNMALAAPTVNPQPTAQSVSLTTPGMTFSAPLVTTGVSTTVSLTTCLMSMQAWPINPVPLIPVYLNPWYENQLDPLSSDFQGPTVP